MTMQDETIRQGTLYTIAAPSGAGKTSLVKALLANNDKLKVSISYTTRPSRPGEVDGVNYRFVDSIEFDRMIANGEFLEHAEVFNYKYGTSNKWVGKQLDKGIDVILEIDWQGVRQIKQLFPECKRIFILPPSLQTLEQRLRARGQDDRKVIADRMQAAKNEIAHFHEAEFILVNDDFEQTVADLQYIMQYGKSPTRQDQATNQALAQSLLRSLD